MTVGSLISFGLAIRGWFANKDSKASKENARVTATLLNDLRPTVVFSMSNDIEGFTLVLTTVMSDGCALGHVKQAAKFRINGKYLQLLEGDKVTASAKNAAGDTVEAECAIIESAEDHIDATLPAAFNGDEFIGREITFKVEGRCGDPEAGTQTKSITAVLDKGDGGDSPTGPKIAYVYSTGRESEHDVVYDGSTAVIKGSGLASATECVFVCKDTAGVEHECEFTLEMESIEVSADGTTIEVVEEDFFEHFMASCSEGDASFDKSAGATVKVKLADGTVLTHNVSFGE